jgi:hypothetical protein
LGCYSQLGRYFVLGRAAEAWHGQWLTLAVCFELIYIPFCKLNCVLTGNNFLLSRLVCSSTVLNLVSLTSAPSTTCSTIFLCTSVLFYQLLWLKAYTCCSATSVDVEEHLYRIATDMGITVVTSSQVSNSIHQFILTLWKLRQQQLGIGADFCAQLDFVSSSLVFPLPVCVFLNLKCVFLKHCLIYLFYRGLL